MHSHSDHLQSFFAFKPLLTRLMLTSGTDPTHSENSIRLDLIFLNITVHKSSKLKKAN